MRMIWVNLKEIRLVLIDCEHPDGSRHTDSSHVDPEVREYYEAPVQIAKQCNAKKEMLWECLLYYHSALPPPTHSNKQNKAPHEL